MVAEKLWRPLLDMVTSWLERSADRHADASQLCMMCAQLAGECVQGLIGLCIITKKK